MKKAFPSFAVRRLASGPRPKPAQRSPRAAPAHLASAQPSALAPSPARRACRRATPRPRQDVLAAWRPCVGVARRAVATTYARAHAPAFNCRSQCTRSLPPALPSLSSRAESPSSAPPAPTHPPAKFAADPPPRPEIARPQLRLALLQVALALAPASELRLSLPELRHRRPWRRRARPPWKSTSFSSPVPPSYPTALAFF